MPGMEGPPETDDTRKRDGSDAVQQRGEGTASPVVPRADAAAGEAAAADAGAATELAAASAEGNEADNVVFMQPLQVQPIVADHAALAPVSDAAMALLEAAAASVPQANVDEATAAATSALDSVSLSEMDRTTLEQLAALAAASTDTGFATSFDPIFPADTPQAVVASGMPLGSSSHSVSPAVPTPTPPITRTMPFTLPSAPVPATPRASDPPIPIDHALTEPIAAFYKLQFYPDHGVDGPPMALDSGGEEDGFAYYMQTLDVTIGRKVIPPPETAKSPVKSPQGVPFDSFISMQDPEQDVKPRISPGGEAAEHVNAEAGPSSAVGARAASNGNEGVSKSGKSEKQVDVDLGALKSVSRLHARIGYSYTLSQFYLEVLGRNGAWIDDVFAVKGSRVALGPRTKIQISTRTFYFVLPPSSIPTYPIPYSSAYAASYNTYNNASPMPSPPSGAALLAAQQASLLPLDGQQKPAAFNAFSNREEWENERMSLFGIGAGMGENGEYGYKRRRRRRHGHRRRHKEDEEMLVGSDEHLSSSGGSDGHHHAGLSGSESCSSCAGSEYWSSASASDREGASGSVSDASSSSLSDVSDSSSSLTSEADEDEGASAHEDRSQRQPASNEARKSGAGQNQPPGKGKGKAATEGTPRKIIKLKVKLPVRTKEGPPPEPVKPSAVPAPTPVQPVAVQAQVAGKHPTQGVKAIKAVKSEEAVPPVNTVITPPPPVPKPPAGPTAEEKAAIAKAVREAKQAEKKAAAEQRRLEKEAAREAARLEKARLKQEALDAKLAKKAQMEAAAAAALASAIRPAPAPAAVPKPESATQPAAVTANGKAAAQATLTTKPTPSAPAAPPRPPQPLQIPRPAESTPAAPTVLQPPPAPPTPSVPPAPVPTLQAQPPSTPSVTASPAASSPAVSGPITAPEAAATVKPEQSDKYDGLPPALAAAIARLPPDAPVPTTSTKALQAALQSGKTAPMEVDPIPLMSGNIPVSVPIPPTGQPRPPPGPILGLDGQPFIGPEPIKPQLTYAAIIFRALSNVDRGRGTLGQVCDWVAGEWEWFRLNPEAGWQNSIRHNLSLNKAFLKVPRIDSDDPESKGSVWVLDPIHAPEFEAKERKAQELKDAKQRRDGDRSGPAKPPVEKPRKPYKKQEPSAKAKADTSKPAGFGLNLKIPPIPAHKNFPIVVAPIPANLKESVVNPNPNLLDGPPLVVHDGTIILNPSIFSHLTAEHLAHLQSLGTQQTLQILQAYIVQYLKDKMRAQQVAKANANAVRPATAGTAAAGTPRPPAPVAKPIVNGAAPSARPSTVPAVRPGAVPVPRPPQPGPGVPTARPPPPRPPTLATPVVRPGAPTAPAVRPAPAALPAPAPVQAQARPPPSTPGVNLATKPPVRPVQSTVPAPAVVAGIAATQPVAVKPNTPASTPPLPSAATPVAKPGLGRPPTRPVRPQTPAARPPAARPPTATAGTPGRPPGVAVRPPGAAVRPVRPPGATGGPSAPGRPRPPAAPAGGKPPLPAETLRILAQLAAASGASAGNNPGGAPIAPGATALLQYLTRVGTAADMSIATKILATGVIPPNAYPDTAAAAPVKAGPTVVRPAGARPATSPAVRPKAGAPVRPASAQGPVAKAGLGGSTPVALSPSPSPRPPAAMAKPPPPANGGLTPLPGRVAGPVSPLPAAATPRPPAPPTSAGSVLGKRPAESPAPPMDTNHEMKKQKVA